MPTFLVPSARLGFLGKMRRFSPSVNNKFGGYSEHRTNKSPFVCLFRSLAYSQVSLGSEAFLLWSYMAASASLPRGLRSTALKAGSLFVDGVSYIMEGRYSGHGTVNSGGFGIGDEGEMLEEGEEHGGLASSTGKEAEGVFAGGGWGGEEFAVAWKVVWMGLMVCCAARQLLSCIQVRDKGGWRLIMLS